MGLVVPWLKVSDVVTRTVHVCYFYEGYEDVSPPRSFFCIDGGDRSIKQEHSLPLRCHCHDLDMDHVAAELAVHLLERLNKQVFMCALLSRA